MSEDNYVSDEDLALLESIKAKAEAAPPPTAPPPDFSGNLNETKLREIFGSRAYQEAMEETDGSFEETTAIYDEYGVPEEARLAFPKKQS